MAIPGSPARYESTSTPEGLGDESMFPDMVFEYADGVPISVEIGAERCEIRASTRRFTSASFAERDYGLLGSLLGEVRSLNMETVRERARTEVALDGIDDPEGNVVNDIMLSAEPQIAEEEQSELNPANIWFNALVEADVPVEEHVVELVLPGEEGVVRWTRLVIGDVTGEGNEGWLIDEDIVRTVALYREMGVPMGGVPDMTVFDITVELDVETDIPGAAANSPSEPIEARVDDQTVLPVQAPFKVIPSQPGYIEEISGNQAFSSDMVNGFVMFSYRRRLVDLSGRQYDAVDLNDKRSTARHESAHIWDEFGDLGSEVQREGWATAVEFGFDLEALRALLREEYEYGREVSQSQILALFSRETGFAKHSAESDVPESEAYALSGTVFAYLADVLGRGGVMDSAPGARTAELDRARGLSAVHDLYALLTGGWTFSVGRDGMMEFIDEDEAEARRGIVAEDEDSYYLAETKGQLLDSLTCVLEFSDFAANWGDAMELAEELLRGYVSAINA